jgi:UDP-N-acetylmuramoylalanine--D-glutamate ligase
VAGNIGFALSKELQDLDENSWVAAELSSFQLEGTTSLAPDVACIVNITPDHFERHGNMAGYVAAKSKIFAFQTPDDILILNADDPVSSGLGKNARSRVIYFSTKKVLPEGGYIEDGWFVLNVDGKKEQICRVSDLQIFGAHNEQDVLAACLSAFFRRVTPENMAQGAESLQGRGTPAGIRDHHPWSKVLQRFQGHQYRLCHQRPWKPSRTAM